MKNRALYILESFFSGERECLEKKEISAKKFMLDSGAFTFMNSRKNITKSEIEDYLTKYCRFILENDVSQFIEMDLDVIFGYAQVKDWRREIEKAVNKPVIPVWHKSRGIEEYKKMLRDYEYCAIGGFAIGEIKRSEFSHVTKMVRFARKNNVRIHGLGYSRTDVERFDFFSVDSASWRMASGRYGEKKHLSRG